MKQIYIMQTFSNKYYWIRVGFGHLEELLHSIKLYNTEMHVFNSISFPWAI